mmetsp:Transcript_32183/g.46778  ORF Transcript_32183/g.46778 Transcript_32183/m.46778 type:complete len:104 (+) Transcript_32183:1461-1772(+)
MCILLCSAVMMLMKWWPQRRIDGDDDDNDDGNDDGDDNEDGDGVGGCVRQPKKRSIISDGRQVNLLVRHSTVVYLLFSRVYLQAASVPRVHHANLTADTETSM